MESYAYSRGLAKAKEREAAAISKESGETIALAMKMRFAALDFDVKIDNKTLFDPSVPIVKRELQCAAPHLYAPETLVPPFKRIRATETPANQIFSFKNAGKVFILSKSNFDLLEKS